MASIQCKACGTVYHYNKEGCCPNCGAYNRPPKREDVRADGTVQHMTDAEYEKRQHAQGKVCFEEKECHEEKVCYEDQARRGSRAGSVPKQAESPLIAETHAPKPTNQAAYYKALAKGASARKTSTSGGPQKRSSLGCLITFIIIAVLIAAVTIVSVSVLSTLRDLYYN